METRTWSGQGLDKLLHHALSLLDRPRRTLLGIAGAPASGKSTLSALLLAELLARRPGEVVLVGMDAFHIGHQVLVRHGLTGVKGAPETFDAPGFLHLLRRLRTETDVTIFAPEFDRNIEDSLAHVIEIPPSVRLVLVEGNYLLLDAPPWDGARPLLDQAWFVHLDENERRRRMVIRHESHGHSHDDAVARTFGTDERNAVLVNTHLILPDVWIEHTFTRL